MAHEASSPGFNHRQSQILIAALSAIVLAAGVLAGWMLTTRGWLPGGGENRAPSLLAGGQRSSAQGDLHTGFSAIAKAVIPAVVTVEASARARTEPFPFFFDPFEEFFERLRPYRDGERRQSSQTPQGRGRLLPSGLGSGVLVRADGYILTNNHVVEGADKVEVTLTDQRRFTAKIAGVDPPSDVAVLRIDASGLPTIPLGDSAGVEVGDVVLAIGNPLGVGQTVTMGIISAKGRSAGAAGSGSYEDFLQIDAAVNRGNSGGALVNTRGEMIGIPSQILSQSGGNIGIGFAIPAEMARQVMDQLLRSGQAPRGKLGVTVGPLTSALAEQFGYKGMKGALVQDVEPGQPAARAGVRPGDIITEFQGRQIEDPGQLRNLIAQTAPGATVKLKVWRDGAMRELSATLGEVARSTPTGAGDRPEAARSALAGVRVENLTPDLLRRLVLPPETRGVVAADLAADSNAAEAGLRHGDVIVEINRQPVGSVTEYGAAVQKAGKKNVLLRVRRAEGARYIAVPAND